MDVRRLLSKRLRWSQNKNVRAELPRKMKTLKTFGATLVALAVASIASAQVNIKVTGSTAYRKADYFAIVNSLNNPQIATTAASGGDMTGAAQSVIVGTGKSGTTYAGQTVTVQTAFAGSVGGINAVVNSLSTIPAGTVPAFPSNATWLLASNITSATPIATVNEGAGTITGFSTVSATSANSDPGSAPVATFSDSFQSSSPFPSPALNDENPTGLGVGVVQFYWVKENDTGNTVAADLTNITALQANLLLAAGELPLSFFTGVSADSSTDVVLVGRNNDSGTRLDTEAEASSSAGAFGFGQSTENQFQPTLDTTGKVNGVNNVGDAGYSSGGNVATALKGIQASGALDDSGNKFIFVGYVGKSDKNTAIAGGATVLNYNGVPYTSDAVVEVGQYSFWAYEHLYFKSGLSATQQGFLKAVGTQLRTVEAPQSGIPIASMSVHRAIEGGAVSP
jgi:hypothetical protein